MLLSRAVNWPEFCSVERRIAVSSKNTKFVGSISLIFSQYSTLNFWTLSVQAKATAPCFFLRLSPNFCLGRHIAVRLTQFPVCGANNSHSSTLRSVLMLSYQYSDECFRISQVTLIVVAPSVLAVSFPRFVVVLPVFGRDFCAPQNMMATFLA